MNPLDVLISEFQEAVKELNRIEARRNQALSEWGRLREALRKGATYPGLLHQYELAVSSMRELDERLSVCQRKLRELDQRMGALKMQRVLDGAMFKPDVRPRS